VISQFKALKNKIAKPIIEMFTSGILSEKNKKATRLLRGKGGIKE
jgi:hypothetical protein